jgi:hypothetical protein
MQGFPTIPHTSVLMSLAIAVHHDTANVQPMLVAVVSHEPRTLKVSILRPNQNLCQTGTEQTPSTSFTANKSGVHKFSKDLGATSKLQTPEW